MLGNRVIDAEDATPVGHQSIQGNGRSPVRYIALILSARCSTRIQQHPVHTSSRHSKKSRQRCHCQRRSREYHCSDAHGFQALAHKRPSP